MSARHIRTPFMDPLVLAIAENQKTVTRRLIKREHPPEPGNVWRACVCRDIDPADTPCVVCESRFDIKARPGDIMDVCEALVRGPKLGKVCYRADGNHTHVVVLSADGREYPVAWPWKVKVIPARYCPTWAVRYHRRLVSVRPERLSQVTDAEAVREGIARLGWEPTREAFLRGFRQMHGLAEDADPWVERREWAPGEVQS